MTSVPLFDFKSYYHRLFVTYELQNPEVLMSQTIWSDETTVRKMPQDRNIQYRVHGSIKKENLPYNHQIQQDGFSVMFWDV